MQHHSKLQHLDLFSGIGGFSLGLEATGGFETKAFCDIEEYPRAILKKNWPHIKQYTDIKELTYEKLKSDGIESIDIITGGYPCQPFSIAGSKKGEEDPRHLWPEYFRLVKECRPTWVIGENVSGHIKLGLDTVLTDLESEGYSTRTFSLSASSIGANHQRERVWIVAYSDVEDTRRGSWGKQFAWDKESFGQWTYEKTERSGNTSEASRSSEGAETLANSESIGSRKQTEQEGRQSFERTSETVANSDSNGHERRLSEVSNKTNAREDTSELGRKSSSEIIRQGNDGGNRKESRINENISGSSNRAEKTSSSSTRIRNVSSKSNDNQNISGQDFIKENNDRTLVQERQGGVQPSKRGGLEHDQAFLRGSDVRQGNDNINKQRVDNVANTNSERGRMWQTGSQDAEDVGQPSGSEKTFGWWNTEPDVGRVAHGVSKRTHRLKCLGNSLIPQIPYYLGKSILEGYATSI